MPPIWSHRKRCVHVGEASLYYEYVPEVRVSSEFVGRRAWRATIFVSAGRRAIQGTTREIEGVQGVRFQCGDLLLRHVHEGDQRYNIFIR